MNTYFALTIGPIYKTLSQAQRTREFWGSSYMFSWIMREIIVGMIKKTAIIDEDILMPHRDEHTNLQKGTGLYHDRMIAVIKPDKKDQVLKDFKDTADVVLKQIEAKSGVPLNVLQSYFRLNAVLLDLDEKQNIVETITNYLDSLELQNPIFHEAYQIDWSEAIDKLNGDEFFYKDAFPKGGDFDFVFDSIPEISSRGLRNASEKEYDQLVKTFITDKFINKRRFPKKIESEIQDKFITQLSGSNLLKDHFRNYHKYIAVVHADGDNLGETIRKIGNDTESVKKLSKALFSFASKAVGVIGSYGGTNVYAGGDDLLFFAPVATVNAREKQTIFHLVDDLDVLFKKVVSENTELNAILADPKPTLSWGISISYYKFPLSEAIVSSRKLLFDDAKEYKDKNAVAFKLIKHTGQFFGATFGKDGNDYKYFTELLKDKFNTETDFISSLQYRISENEALLRAIFKATDYPTRVGNFFDNFFDEEIHNQKEKFIRNVQKMLIQAFDNTALPKDFDTMKEEKQEKAHAVRVKTAIEKTYSALRFIHFLNSKSDE